MLCVVSDVWLVMRAQPGRRVVLKKRSRGVAIFSLLAIALLLTWSASANDTKASHWVGTWACSPQLADLPGEPSAPAFADTTLRQIVHISVGGTKIRVRFSNAFGRTALIITSAHVAKAAVHGAIQAGTDKPLTFDEQPTVTIPTGALMYSDPLDFDLPALSDLAVTIYLNNPPEGITTHAGSRATSYLASGDAVSASELPSTQAVDHWYFLNGVDVLTPNSSAAAVVLGDSITDGKGSSTNGNGRWPDVLARRLHANKRTVNVGVLNEGIGGNRLLHDGLGPNALARLDRDVLSQTGVRWLVIFEGVNDIGTCTGACDHEATAHDIIAAYQQIILRAHSHNIRVYGATITPLGGSFYATPRTEQACQTVNQWIRASGQFDAVIDFDVAARDPQNPSQLSAQVDGGDHLHPGETGYKIMADSVNLKLFAK
jgi:lysophospholipase L1-like esterase